MSRTAAVPIPTRGASRPMAPTALEARLSLSEVLIACDLGEECAERTLQWLSEQAGAQQVVCLALDANQRRMAPLASWGVSAEALATLTLDVEERSHPLVAALYSRRPVTYDARTDVGMGHVRSVAVPLYGFDKSEDVPTGVLL